MAALALVLTGLMSGCSHDTDEASSQSCHVLSRFNQAAERVASPEEGLTVLSSYEPELEDQLTTAPEDMRADLSVVIKASKDAIAARDLTPLLSDEVVAAGSRLSTKCRIEPAETGTGTTAESGVSGS